MNKVTKEEFYKIIGPLDVTLTIINPYGHPYTTVFKMRHSGRKVGRAVDSKPEGKQWPITTTYYLRSDS